MFKKSFKVAIVATTLFSLLMTNFAGLKIRIASADDFFAGGTGLEEDPYQIETCEQLQNMNEDLNAYYVLTDDIDCSDTANWDDGDGGDPEGFDPIGSGAETFNGSFDGDGYTISSLFIDRPNTSYVGLFAVTSSSISNFQLTDVDITGYTIVGSVVGETLSGSISRVSVTDGTVSAVADMVGGVVGNHSQWGTISDVYSGVTVISNFAASSSNHSYNGGIVGRTGGTITTTFFYGDVLNLNPGNDQDHAYNGGIVGSTWNAGGITNSYYVVGDICPLCGESTAGVEISQGVLTTEGFFGGFDFDNAWYMGDSHPLLRFTHQINTCQELQDIVTNYPNGQADTYVITADFSCGGVNSDGNFVPISWGGGNEFSGILDGYNYTISDLTINDGDNDYVGIFKETSNTATFRYLNLSDVSVSSSLGSAYVGVLVGRVTSNVDVVYVNIDGVVSNIDGSNTGGFFGYVSANNSTILGGSFTGSVTGGDKVGGLIGVAEVGAMEGPPLFIDRSYVDVDVTGNSKIGGFIGGINFMESYAYPSIEQSYTAGNIVGTDGVGGFVGDMTSISMGDPNTHIGLQIEDAYSIANIIGSINVGGLYGYSENLDNNSISNAYFGGVIDGDEAIDYFGGIIGYSDSVDNIANVFMAGDFSGDAGEPLSMLMNSSNTSLMSGVTNFHYYNGYDPGVWCFYYTGQEGNLPCGDSNTHDLNYFKTDGYDGSPMYMWNFEGVEGGDPVWVAASGDFPTLYAISGDDPDTIVFGESTPANESELEGASATISIETSNEDHHYVINDFDDSLVGWWRGEEGTVTVTDEAGGENDGDLIGATFDTGKFGRAMSFDGTGFIEVVSEESLQISDNFTVSAWAKPVEQGAGWKTIIANEWYWPFSGILVSMDGTTGYVHVAAGDGDDFDAVDGNTNIADGEWHLVTVLFSSGTVQIYIDGELDLEESLDGVDFIAYETDTVRIGMNSDDNIEYWKGLIDEVTIFNRVLSEEEILSLYDASETQYENIFSDLAGGEHTATAYAVDLEGNKISTEERMFSVAEEVSFAGGDGTEGDPWQIETCEQLQAINGDLDAFYELISDVDCSMTDPDAEGFEEYGVTWEDGFGFEPIGSCNYGEGCAEEEAFTGCLNGNGYIIRDLYIDRYDEGLDDYDAALFALISDGMGECDEVSNLGIEDADINGGRNSGALAVYVNSGAAIDRVYSTGSVGGSYGAGGLVGRNSGTISESYSEVNVTAQDGYVGGLVGYNVDGGLITESFSSGNVVGTESVGGLIGSMEFANASDVYSKSNVEGDDTVGGLIGDCGSNCMVVNAYSSGNVVGENNVGGLFGYGDYFWLSQSFTTSLINYQDDGITNFGGAVGSVSGLDTGTLYWFDQYDGELDCYQEGNDGCVVIGQGDENDVSYFYAATNPPLSEWNFDEVWYQKNGDYPDLLWRMVFADGSGAEEDPYQIETCEQLQIIGSDTDYLDDYYILNNDIDCSMTNPDDNNFDSWGTWSDGLGFGPIGSCDLEEGCADERPFIGSLDGNGYAITGLYISRSEEENGDAALFGLIGDGEAEYEVYDLGLEDVDISGNDSSGALAVLTYEGSAIYRVYSTGSVRGSYSAGGLIGRNEGTILESYSEVTVSSEEGHVGGLVGFNMDVIANSYSSGDVVGGGEGACNSVGGLVGKSFGEISYSYSKSNVSAACDYVGGFIGFDGGNGLTNSFSAGSVTLMDEEDEYLGGFVGKGIAEYDYSSNWWFNNLEDGMGGSPSEGEPETATGASDFQGGYEYSPLDFWDFEGTWIATENYYPTLYGILADDPVFFGGSGTEEDPYQIETCEQLQAIGGYGGRYLTNHFILIDDIDCSATEEWNPFENEGFCVGDNSIDNEADCVDEDRTWYWEVPSGQGFNPIGCNTTSNLCGDRNYYGTIENNFFTGTLDGDNGEGGNYEIQNLYIQRNEDFIGLFGMVGDGAEITNVDITGAYIQAFGEVDSVGILGGYISTSSTIDNVNVSGEVDADEAYNVGGLGGYHDVPDVCFLGGTQILLEDGSYKNIEEVKVGDIVQSFDEISQQKVFGKVAQTFIHEADEYLVINNNLKVTPNHPLYVNGEWKEAGNIIIGDILMNENGQNVEVYSIQGVYDTVPVYNLEVKPETEVEGTCGPGHSYFADGILAHNKCPIISTDNGNGYEFNSKLNVYNTGKENEGVFNYKLNPFNNSIVKMTYDPTEKNIDYVDYIAIKIIDTNGLNTVTHTLEPVACTGANSCDLSLLKKVDEKYLVLSENNREVDLDFGELPVLSNGYERSFEVISNGYHEPLEHVGMYKYPTYIQDWFREYYYYTHPGTHHTIIDSSAYSVDVYGYENVGGLIGFNAGTITDSFAIGTVFGVNEVGGFVGYNNGGVISDSYSDVEVEADGYYVGGFMGHLTGDEEVSNNYSLGEVYGNDGVGGFVGFNDYGTIATSYSSGNVTCDDYDTGGFVGKNFGNIRDTYATGEVTNENSEGYNIGGFVGLNYGDIFTSYSTGDLTVTETTEAVGGFAGRNGGDSIFSSFSTGGITNGSFSEGENSVGLFAGFNFPDYGYGIYDSGVYLSADETLVGINNNDYENDDSDDIYTTTEVADFHDAENIVYTNGTYIWDFETVWDSHVDNFPTLHAVMVPDPIDDVYVNFLWTEEDNNCDGTWNVECFDNMEDAIGAVVEGGTVHATNNWWGDTSGPTILTNPQGEGTEIVVTDQYTVLYRPFCTDEECSDDALSTYETDSDNLDILFADGGTMTVPGVEGDDYSVITQININEDTTIIIPVTETADTIITLPAGTAITRYGEETTFNAADLVAEDMDLDLLSGFSSGTLVGAFQWGIPSLGLEFSDPITVEMFVGTSLDDETLTVKRSLSTDGGWTQEGLLWIDSEDEDGVNGTCLVSEGICSFRTTLASYYAASEDSHHHNNNSTGSSSVSSTTPVVTLTASVTNLTGGETSKITWSTSGSGIDTVGLYYSTNSGSTYNQIVYNLNKSLGTYDWVVPNFSSTQAKVKIIGYDSGKAVLDTDISDEFIITAVESEEELEDKEPETTIDKEGRTVANNSGLTGPSPVDGTIENISVVVAGQFIRSYYFDTVYYVDEQNIRHPFWDTNTYFTYADSFDEIVWVTDATLPTLTLGSPMLPAPGTVLVKIQSDSKVYAVDSDNTLRLVPDETTAIALFGSNWSDYVIDLEPTIFAHFTLGSELTSTDTIDISYMKTRMELAEMAK